MKKLRICIALLLILVVFPATAQTLEQLRTEVEQHEKEIERINSLLSKNTSSQKANQNQLKLIRNRINNRRQILSNLNKQSDLINKNINSKNDTIGLLENDIRHLREEYAAMIYDNYKNYKINNYMAFLFSSRDFNDATRRIIFMRRQNRMRKEKAAEIDSASLHLTGQIQDLKSKHEELEKLRETRNTEINALAKDETQYKNAETSLNKERGTLNAQLKKEQEERNRLQQQIRKIIEEQARKEKNTQRTAAEEEYIALLSGKFEENRGKLPYPIRGGVIVDQFGVHAHATLKNVTVNNLGVDIAGESGSEVRAVFEGEVSGVYVVAQGICVMVRHGNYISAYANLASASVKVGNRVSAGQTLGKLATSSNSDDCVLLFTVWLNGKNINPEPWLRK